MKKLFLAAIVLFTIASCSEEVKDAVSSTSPNKKITITVSAKREMPLSPWQTEVVAAGIGLKGNISFEFYAKEVSDKTVSFVWDKDKTCTITFHQQDDTKRIFLFTPNSTETLWTDMTPK